MLLEVEEAFEPGDDAPSTVEVTFATVEAVELEVVVEEATEAENKLTAAAAAAGNKNGGTFGLKYQRYQLPLKYLNQIIYSPWPMLRRKRKMWLMKSMQSWMPTMMMVMMWEVVTQAGAAIIVIVVVVHRGAVLVQLGLARTSLVLNRCFEIKQCVFPLKERPFRFREFLCLPSLFIAESKHFFSRQARH